MNERENILGRIREGLTVPAPIPGHAHEVVPRAPMVPRSTSEIRQWLPPVGDTFEQGLESFRKNAAALRIDFHLVENRDQLAGTLRKLRDSEGWDKVGLHSGDLTDFAATQLGLPLCVTDNGYDVVDLESCSVGITECDALVAQTGSVLVTSRTARGRALSLLPAHHLLMARPEPLLSYFPS